MDHPATKAVDPPARPTIGALLSDLANDGKAFVDAEFGRYRAYGKRTAIAAAIVAGLFIVAVTLLQGALIALLIGLVLWLQPAVGTGWAIAIVVVGATLIAIVLGMIGAQRARRILPDRKPG